jgi:hypothetical protein
MSMQEPLNVASQSDHVFSRDQHVVLKLLYPRLGSTWKTRQYVVPVGTLSVVDVDH